jgi:hypothetical protein
MSEPTKVIHVGESQHDRLKTRAQATGMKLGPLTNQVIDAGLLALEPKPKKGKQNGKDK